MKYFTAKSEEELKKEYRKLSKMYHPDNLNTGDEIKFKEVSEEYLQLKNKIQGDKPLDLHETSRAASEILDDLLSGVGFENYRFTLKGPSLDFIISCKNSLKDIEMMLTYVAQLQKYGYLISSYLEFADEQLFILPLSYGMCIMKNIAQRIPAPTSTKIFKNYVVTVCGKISVATNIGGKQLIYLERPADDLMGLIRHRSVRKKED